MTDRLNLVFAGTPDFAVPALDALHAAGHVLRAVYTQPDRPAGRGQAMSGSPVKRRALELGLHVEQSASLKAPEEALRLEEHAADLMVVVAYGLILPPAILAIPRLGCWNIHASLLPRWRGAAPIQRAILAGDAATGVTIMQMDAGLDTGPMLLRRATPIDPRETGGTLHDRLARLGAQAIVEANPSTAPAMRRRSARRKAGSTGASRRLRSTARSGPSIRGPSPRRAGRIGSYGSGRPRSCRRRATRNREACLRPRADG
jgi:methionyl-tRNA formyltransferase